MCIEISFSPYIYFDSSAKVCNTSTWKHHSPVKKSSNWNIVIMWGAALPNNTQSSNLFSLSRQCWRFKSPDTSGSFMTTRIGAWGHCSMAMHGTVLKRNMAIQYTTNNHRISIPVTIQGVYLCSLFCRYKAVCDTLGLQNDHQKIYLVYILGSTGFLQNDLVFLQGQHGKKTPNKTSYVNPRMHFVGFSNSRQTWGII